MNQLVDDLLKLSRLNKSLSDVSETDLSKIASEIRESLQERSIGRKVHFTIEEDVKLRCDAGLMRIVLTNLIENAWKFTAQKPDAEIEFGRRVGYGAETLFIRDNGAGFDMAFRERLFQPFQRLHSANAFPGTGIGLATVARIIRLHGGKIWAEARPGEGATFYFQLGRTLPGAVESDLSGTEPNPGNSHHAEICKAATG
jgi:signal transduction histidine kinase